MTTAARQLLTPAEYLEIERAAEQKSEFFAGEMFAMAGASEPHNTLTANVIGELYAQLKGQPCRVYPSDLRLKVSETGLYTYPDVMVVCGQPQLEDTKGDTLLNPTLIVEVLSGTTEAYDRGDKFGHYGRLESLREYVLIAQEQLRIERFTRPAEGQEWQYAAVSDPQGVVALASIGCELSLADVYAQVELPKDEGPLRPPYSHR